MPVGVPAPLERIAPDRIRSGLQARPRGMTMGVGWWWRPSSETASFVSSSASRSCSGFYMLSAK